MISGKRTDITEELKSETTKTKRKNMGSSETKITQNPGASAKINDKDPQDTVGKAPNRYKKQQNRELFPPERIRSI